MELSVSTEELKAQQIPQDEILKFTALLNTSLAQHSTPANAWQHISQHILKNASVKLKRLMFEKLFPMWKTKPQTAPIYLPTHAEIANANIKKFMNSLHVGNVPDLYSWSTDNKEAFWEKVIQTLNIHFQTPPHSICELSDGVANISWLPGAKFNIAESCFNAPDYKTALIFSNPDGLLKKISYGELNQYSNQIAFSLLQHGFKSGDVIGICLGMSFKAIAIYLGIIKMGGVVASIADSFSGEEVATRLDIAKAKALFTQKHTLWNGKEIPLLEKLLSTKQLVNCDIFLIDENISVKSSSSKIVTWHQFMQEAGNFQPVACEPMAPINLLFSSGTTGLPKAIIWNHTTPIKSASDGFFHQNIHTDDVIAWPSNLGWMMGPWLIFAGLMNGATLAIYHDAPKDKAFGEFIEKAQVSILGVVPTLVASWRQTKCMETLDWSKIKLFTTTGECSNTSDMFYLSSLANFRPIIEYCGGTEIGGAYLTGTVIEPNYLTLFSTPAMGSDLLILDEAGRRSDHGEVALIPPAMGLSTRLLNADHYETYYAKMPTLPNVILRRHGDLVTKLENNYYAVLGRQDDTMNLGGIKVSSVEIERILRDIPNVNEIAAVATSSSQVPNQLVIFVTLNDNTIDLHILKNVMQTQINQRLNPLFKIHKIILKDTLPKTASNKIIRRLLRDSFFNDATSVLTDRP